MEKSKTVTLGGKKLGTRYAQVVEGIHACKLNKQIAEDMGITEGTVKEYTFRLNKMLNLHSTNRNNRVMIALMWEREHVANTNDLTGIS